MYGKLLKIDRKITTLFQKISSEEYLKEKRDFVKKCPLNDCKGYLSLTNNLHCQLCEKIFCEDCFEEKKKIMYVTLIY